MMVSLPPSRRAIVPIIPSRSNNFPLPHFHRASTIAPKIPVNTYRSYRIRGGFRGNYAVNNHDLEVGGVRLNGAMGA